jgi:hypothetical protein
MQRHIVEHLSVDKQSAPLRVLFNDLSIEDHIYDVFRFYPVLFRLNDGMSVITVLVVTDECPDLLNGDQDAPTTLPTR